jgi:hypothetical protein
MTWVEKKPKYLDLDKKTTSYNVIQSYIFLRR